MFLKHAFRSSMTFNAQLRRLVSKCFGKSKRNIGSIAHPRYRNFADQMSERTNVVIVDPDIAAHRVIEASEAVISMPFTSTSLIARELGKPTCYYDPSAWFEKMTGLLME